MVRGWKLVRQALPKVTAPLLLLRAPGDHLVDPSSARIILANVSSKDVTETLLENSYHVATLDNDAPQIFEESAAFIQRVAAP
jgi:carboxylesterase